MRPVLFFDVEGTGFNTGENEVIQFSGILYDIDQDKMVTYFDSYCWTDVPISPGAYQAHGIDMKTLAKLSNRETLEYRVYGKLKPLLDIPTLSFCAFNAPYDLGMINTTLLRHGYEGINFGKEIPTHDVERLAGNVRSHFCMMKYMKSNPKYASSGKQTEYANAAGLKISTLKEEFLKDFPEAAFAKNHSALFDAYVLMHLSRRTLFERGS